MTDRVTVHHVTVPEIRERIRVAVKPYRLTLDEFIGYGLSDDLDDPTLRDLWLLWGDLLTDEDDDT